MRRAYYQDSVESFLSTNENDILGELTRNHQHDLNLLQRNAWILQIESLKESLSGFSDGYLLLEYAIPRMGKRVDAVLLSGGIIFVLEYKVGATAYGGNAIDQVLDYALDLKNFHKASHDPPVVPVLVATEAPDAPWNVSWYPDGVQDRYGRHLRVGIDEGLAAGGGTRRSIQPRGVPAPTMTDSNNRGSSQSPVSRAWR